MSNGLELDWSTATVKDGKLTIQIGGDPPKDWKDRFERSVKLLHGGGGDWAEVKPEKNAIHVDGVTPGSEDKLRHFLEGVIQQVNAALDEPDEDEGDSPAADTPDGQMTQRFREFGEQEPAEADSDD